MTGHTPFPLISYEEASPEVKEIYDDILDKMGSPSLPTLFRALGSNPNLLKATWTKIYHTLYLGDVPRVLKQLILFKISKDQGCKYCTFVHQAAVNSMSASVCNEDDFVLTENLESNKIPLSYRVAVKVVSKCASDPRSTTDEDYNALYEVGFCQEEVMELFAQADLCNMLNTFVDISQIELDKSFYAQD